MIYLPLAFGDSIARIWAFATSVETCQDKQEMKQASERTSDIHERKPQVDYDWECTICAQLKYPGTGINLACVGNGRPNYEGRLLRTMHQTPGIVETGKYISMRTLRTIRSNPSFWCSYMKFQAASSASLLE